ncbi:Proline-specific permease [Lachnellula subtilissima]|uniref:Proline-specific permease n=1 Tax=Lachnellula subtilissima TaxID=602034 RepID=A0A8H8RSX3_9HELO|nr:Proline-specific permease [Lachnellula subtilissima]
MAISPVSSGSDAEKGIYRSDQKTAQFDGEKAAPGYAEEPVAEDGSVIDFEETRELKQGLNQRHIQMIALCGAIGTVGFSTWLYRNINTDICLIGIVPWIRQGSFKGRASGSIVRVSTSANILCINTAVSLGYSFVGALVTGVVLSIAELSALVPLTGSIIRHAEYFVDPALSFAQGWNTVYNHMVTLPAELVAAAVIIQFWSTVNSAVWITICGVLLVISNVLFVRVYGELEFTFATLKIMLIVGLNIMALVVTCGGGPDHHKYGFQYWRNPGPFVQYLGYGGSLGQFMGFYTTFSNAVYAYSGVETISVAAAETQNPRRNIPIAAKRIFWRVAIFYCLSIFMVGLIVPSNDPSLLKSIGTAVRKSTTDWTFFAAQSPFVIAATRAGIKIVPSIINAVVLTSAWSSGNSGLLGGSRTLYGMAKEGHAPKFFLRVNRMGIPYIAVCSLALFIGLGYMTLSDSASTVFGWLQDLVSVSALVGWLIICIVYLRFYYGMKKQGIDRSELPWKAPLQPYAAWISLIAFTILLLTGGYTVFLHKHWDTETFVSSYINIPIILGLYFGYKLFRKTKIVSLEDMPIRQFIDIANANPEPPAKPLTGWRRLNILWS